MPSWSAAGTTGWSPPPTWPGAGWARWCASAGTWSAAPRSASTRSAPTTRSRRCRTWCPCCPPIWSATCGWSGTATTSTRRARTSRPRRDGRYLRLPDDPAARHARDRQVLRRRRRRLRRLRGARWPGIGRLVGPLLDEIPPQLGSRRPADLSAQARLLRAAARGRRARRGRPDPAAHRRASPTWSTATSRATRCAALLVGLRRHRHLGRARGRPAPRT